MQPSIPPEAGEPPVRVYRSYHLEFETGFTLYGALLDGLLKNHPEWLRGGAEEADLAKREFSRTYCEVMTTAIIGMLYFRGNFCLASQYLYEHRYLPNMLS